MSPPAELRSRRSWRLGLCVVAGAGMAAAGAVCGRVTPFGTITFVAAIVALGGAAVVVTAIRRWQRDTTAVAGRALGGAASIGALLAAVLLGWVGANDPTVAWFGRITVHGDRSDNRIAITFDDGPDDPFTLEAAGILEQHGVRGTFFQVGHAIDERPDIVRALYDRGHLLANHSYHHDYWRWLDPRYPELQRTQDAFARAVGQCPAFFRPPHGQRTPFMLARVSAEGMSAVTWDVSASDWTDTDGADVAKRVLDRTKPGSIILLHDGLDGNVGADRSVLRTALPLILDGLQQRGLRAVRLDELLDRPGYLEKC